MTFDAVPSVLTLCEYTHNSCIHYVLLCSLVLSAVLYYVLLPPNVRKVGESMLPPAVPVKLHSRKDHSVAGREKRHNGGERPPAYPNGWIPVEESRNVTSTKITKSTVFVHNIVLVRDKHGRVSAFDAICPHLGAHLAYGGTTLMRDDQTCIRCPFHGWMFSADDGNCIAVPYAENESKMMNVCYSILTCFQRAAERRQTQQVAMLRVERFRLRLVPCRRITANLDARQRAPNNKQRMGLRWTH